MQSKATLLAAIVLSAFIAKLPSFVTPSKAEEIVVTSWGANLNSIPYAVAMEKGFFKDAGFDVTSVLATSGGGNAVRNVLASETPYGEVSLDAAISAAKSGLAIVIVNAACRTVSEATWVAKRGSSIGALDDLKGKRVAYTRPRSVSEMLLILSLNSRGLDLGSVKRTAAGGYREGLILLDNGAVDVAPVIEPQASSLDENYKRVFRAADYLKPMITTVGITTPEYAKGHAHELSAIVAGYRKGVQYTYDHPDEAAEITARHTTMKADALKVAIANVAPFHFWSDGQLDLGELNNMVDGLRLIGMLEGQVDWSSLLDQSFLQDSPHKSGSSVPVPHG